MNNWPLIIILGPTASGKSSLALRLASEFSAEIVNCDSVQVYRYLNIGTSKPSWEEQAEIAHHLLDFLEPDAVFTAGDFMTQGRQMLSEIQSREKIPLVVAGTGLYLRALLDGLFRGPKRSENLRHRFHRIAGRWGIPQLHRLLRRVDPLSAEKISSMDKPKLIRALEVYWLTRRPLSELFLAGKEPLEGFRILKIGLNPPREQLYEAINQRVQQMFKRGLVDEVRQILEMGYSVNAKPLQSLGYAQVIQMLNGSISPEEAVTLTQQFTRNYSKRQLTWFRRERNVTWIAGFGHQQETYVAAQCCLKDHLTKSI